MPYVITTKQVNATDAQSLTVLARVHTVSRRAVATLEQAQAAYENVVRQRVLDPDAFEGWIWEQVPESGGTVGPLPDGTVIEVEQVTWTALYNVSGLGGGIGFMAEGRDGVSTTESARTLILDAYNARQGQP